MRMCKAFVVYSSTVSCVRGSGDGQRMGGWHVNGRSELADMDRPDRCWGRLRCGLLDETRRVEAWTRRKWRKRGGVAGEVACVCGLVDRRRNALGAHDTRVHRAVDRKSTSLSLYAPSTLYSPFPIVLTPPAHPCPSHCGSVPTPPCGAARSVLPCQLYLREVEHELGLEVLWRLDDLCRFPLRRGRERR